MGRIWIVACMLLVGGAAEASFVVPPALGGRDGALAGNTVATPADGVSILWENSAGAVDAPSETTASGFLVFSSGHYSNPAIGYDTKSSEIPLAPALWVGGHRGPWSVGAGVYGSVGSSFNFPGNPSAGVPNRFLAELSVIHLGLVLGRELAPGLRLAVQAAPTYGSIRVRTPSPAGPVAFDVDGFGMTGALGLLYDVGARTTFGLSYRSPGIVFMSGDGSAGGSPESVKIDFRIPQSVRFGVATEVLPALTLALQARWTHYPEFEDGRFEFRRHPMLDQKFISSARSTFRYGAGLEYAVRDFVALRAGVSREEWMMEGSSLSPLLYDTSDVIFSLGLGVRFDPWSVDVVVGDSISQDRNVGAGENPRFPGTYQLQGGVAGVAISYRFHGAPGI